VLKIAVATIAKNEENFVDSFMGSAGEADAIYVLDTGSTDHTTSLLRERGAVVQVQTFDPWRFDVARNVAHALVPTDVSIVVSVDLDEIFTPGWAEILRAGWTVGTTRARYQYVWSHHPDGSPATTFWADKIVQRKNYRWVR